MRRGDGSPDPQPCIIHLEHLQEGLPELGRLWGHPERILLVEGLQFHSLHKGLQSCTINVKLTRYVLLCCIDVHKFYLKGGESWAVCIAPGILVILV